MLRAVAVVAAYAAVALGASVAPAEAKVSYKLCNNPDKVYRVVAVHKASCRLGKNLAAEYSRRLNANYSDGEDLDLRHVWGWSCGSPRGGNYYGLYGSRTVCAKGGGRIRFHYRGE